MHTRLGSYCMEASHKKAKQGAIQCRPHLFRLPAGGGTFVLIAGWKAVSAGGVKKRGFQPRRGDTHSGFFRHVHDDI